MGNHSNLSPPPKAIKRFTYSLTVPKMLELMIQALCPVSPQWVHSFVIEPYLEGCERVNRAWQGVDFHSLTRAPLFFKERIWEWLKGTLLLTPIVGGLFWLLWQTFGSPSKWSDPYCPEINQLPPVHVVEQPPLPVAQPIAAPPAPAAVPVVQPDPGGAQIEQFSFNEARESFVMKTNWKIKNSPHVIIAYKNCEKSKSTSRYSPGWAIQDFYEQEMVSGKFCHFKLIDPQHIEVIISEGNIHKTHKLDKPFPWIQQPTIGFKNFVLSNEKELSFYGIRPDNGELILMMAKKMGEEDIPGLGRVVKLRTGIHPSSWLYYSPINLIRSELWLDPQTGILRKLEADGALVDKLTIEFLRNDPLPAPAHP